MIIWFFSFNLNQFALVNFSKSWDCTRRSGSCNLTLWKTHLCELIPNWTRFRMITYTNAIIEVGATVSNNFTKRGQNGFKMGAKDKFASHWRWEDLISNEIVIYTISFTIGDFPFSNSLIIHKVKTKEITTVTVVWISDLN